MSNISKNNTSGYRGVSYETKAHKYRAYIHYAGVKIALGYFPTAEEANAARQTALSIYKTKVDSGEYRIFDYYKKTRGYSDLGCYQALWGAIKGYDFNISFAVYAAQNQKAEPISEDALTTMKNLSTTRPAVFRFLNGEPLSKMTKDEQKDIRAFFKECR